ncbi:MAG: hypothetical protein JWM76_3894 [Pseudonocardiales bacterium]|nr:hypothetical protein [Pseudonocardiales bacterium]
MTASVSLSDARSVVQISRDIADQKDLAGARARIVELAVETVGFGAAAIWTCVSHGGLRLDISSDPQQVEGLVAVSKSAPGLGLACFEARETIEVPDFTTERRWPDYVEQLLAGTPIRSGVAFYLGTPNRSLGVLTLYATEPNAYTPSHLAAAATYAELATLALTAASDADKVLNLELALESNRRIGIAIGVLMALKHVTDEQAFIMIREASQARHMKLRDVAEVIAMTGTMPVS